MKLSKFSVVLILLYIFIHINVFGSDPIDDSFIINSLEMDIDEPPSQSDEEKALGEIIFDNSFCDKIKNTKIKSNITVDSAKHEIKKLKSEDHRWHILNYKVKKNESLWLISKKFKIDYNLIIKMNNIKHPDFIQEGEKLKIPSKNGITYKIKRGDTLGEISQKYNIDIEKIIRHNNLSGNKIIAGRNLFLPDAVEIIEKGKKTETIETCSSVKKNTEEGTFKKSKLVFSWPLRGPITSNFGYRKHPLSGKKKFHCGLDIGANIGTKIYASEDGKVIFSGWKESYGKMIVIAHDKNYITVYAHNSKNMVKVNEKVKRGDNIALSGKTGAVTGAHLHFEIRKGIIPLNPMRILKK